MKVLFMCGSDRRHLYIANKLYKEGFLSSLVIENRPCFIPEPPENLDSEIKQIFINHFNDRSYCEQKYFGNSIDEILNIKGAAKIPKININQQDLNSDYVQKFIVENNPDIVITYGVHIIRKEVLDIMPDIKWNIHGGLSPWYKGNVTMYWPIYMLKPNWVGATIHELTNKLDGGNIIHHSVPKLSYGDKVHDVACKAILQTTDDLICILNLMKTGNKIIPVEQRGNGKLWVTTDWTPEHLRPVYKLYDNKIVDMFLDGKLQITEPKLVKAF